MPNVAVNVAVIHDEEILLMKREDFEIRCLPGGMVNENDSLAEAAVREVREETGADMEINNSIEVDGQ